MSDFLQHKLALITGASRGLGRAISLALAGEGVRLALVSRDAERLEHTAEQARVRGAEAVSFTADVTCEEDVLHLEREVSERMGRVQIVVNNAGINVRKRITDFTLAEWRSVIDTNLIGAFLISRSFVPHMLGTGYGRIINLTSMMSHVSLAERTAYSASKAGLLGFTKALALELASEGITVVGISPGPVATEMNLPLIQNPDLNRQFTSRIPVGRWGKEEEIAKLAVYLCSEEAGYITGTDILIDGGWCAA